MKKEDFLESFQFSNIIFVQYHIEKKWKIHIFLLLHIQQHFHYRFASALKSSLKNGHTGKKHTHSNQFIFSRILSSHFVLWVFRLAWKCHYSEYIFFPLFPKCVRFRFFQSPIDVKKIVMHSIIQRQRIVTQFGQSGRL